MGLFAWVKKGTEQTVYTRFHSRAQFATTGGANLAASDLLGASTKWDSALSSSYDVYTDSFTLVTITVDAIGIP